MPTFALYASSEEEQAHLRCESQRCVELLRGCQPLAEKLAATGGLSAPLDGGDERVLQDFHLVQQAFAGSGDKGDFERLCRQAGLRERMTGVLAGRVQTLYQEREPVLYEAEAYAIIYQWHLNKQQRQE
jgi:hypothetical protein